VQPSASLGDVMPKAKERTSDFGARLTELRKAAGYTQVELAAALGTTQRMIAYYESRAEKAPAALLGSIQNFVCLSHTFEKERE
jgi:transcriptional regulator with XRE-family HTH domain